MRRVPAARVVLALAMLIMPPATAYLLTRRLSEMIVLAPAIGALSALFGLYLSFYLDLASGPSMVLMATGAFALALVLAPEQGLLRGPCSGAGPARQTSTHVLPSTRTLHARCPWPVPGPARAGVRQAGRDGVPVKRPVQPLQTVLDGDAGQPLQGRQQHSNPGLGSRR